MSSIPVFFKLFVVAFLLTIVAPGLASCQKAERKPNIVFIIADDCTFRDVGCYGGQAYTPHIDRLAQQGMLFRRCFQSSPMCSPTRHTIYTGLYPVKSGAFCNHTFAYDKVKSIVHYLKPLGYRVALSGKTHIGPKSVFPFEYSRNKKGKKNAKSKTKSVIDFEAVNRIFQESAASEKPFALFACSNAPHTPWNLGKKFLSKYKPSELKLRPYMVDTPETRKSYADYLAEISFFDSEVGMILEALKKHQLENNTLVMVVSEQGNSFPFAKWSCYDSGLQSAMVVRWPGKVKPKSETSAMVEYVDICPTLVAAAGSKLNPDFDGKSMLPILFGQTDQLKTHVYGLQTTRGIFNGPHHYPIRSVRDEQFKLIWNLDPDAKFHNLINKTTWFQSWEKSAENHAHAKAMVKRFRSRPEFELYDISKDPFEMSNLAADPKYAAIVDKLKTNLKNWMKSQGDQGLETELRAFERMKNGNQEYKAWAKSRRKK